MHNGASVTFSGLRNFAPGNVTLKSYFNFGLSNLQKSNFSDPKKLTSFPESIRSMPRYNI